MSEPRYEAAFWKKSKSPKWDEKRLKKLTHTVQIDVALFV